MFFNNIQKKIKKITNQSLINELLKNIYRNSIISKKHFSIKELKNDSSLKKKAALVVAGGPSLRKNNHISLIKKYREKVAIICADGSLFYLLENNIIPDIVVTLDPHKTRIVRWFGDIKLNKLNALKDDYYRRQDLDLKLRDEINTNKKIIKLTNKYGKKLKIAVCTSSSKKVVDRIQNIKSNLYWWDPFLDNIRAKNSLSRKIFKKNKLPLLNSLGNVGSACWIFAETVLGIKNIAIIGMDFSYYIDTPIQSTQYYDVLKKNFNEKNVLKFYKKIFNPRIEKFFYTDHVYYWYKNIFLDAIKSSNSKTFNCSNGGILFEKPVIWSELSQFLKKKL